MNSLNLTVKETASALGVCADLVYDMLHQGRIPHIRVGKRYLVPRQELVAWLEQEAGKPRPPVRRDGCSIPTANSQIP